MVHVLTALDDWVYALPRHPFGPCQHRGHIHEFGAVPVPLQDAPTPLDRILLAMIRRGGQQVNWRADAIAKRHHPMETRCPPPTAFGAVLHFDLPPRPGHLLTLLSRRPPRFARVRDTITRLVGAPKGEGELRGICIHDATRNVLFLQAQIMITGPGIPSGKATP